MTAWRLVRGGVLGGVLAVAGGCGDPPNHKNETPAKQAPTAKEEPKAKASPDTGAAAKDQAQEKGRELESSRPGMESSRPGTESSRPGEAKDPMTTPANPTLPIETVTIAGKVFKLEAATTNEQRFHGLSGRTSIPADGGMLFVMPSSQVSRQYFVMRDCPIPIDIIYLDTRGGIVGMHKMVPEPARSEAEKKLSPAYPNAPQWTWSNEAYEARLKKYPSKYPAQFVIELAGNTLDALGLKDGQKIELDLERLKKLAQ